MLPDERVQFVQNVRFEPMIFCQRNRRFDPELGNAVGRLNVHMPPGFLTAVEKETVRSNSENRW
jgi:hypothetical protein